MRSIGELVDMGLEVATSDTGGGSALAVLGAAVAGAAALGRVYWIWEADIPPCGYEPGFGGQDFEPLAFAAEMVGAKYDKRAKSWVQFRTRKQLRDFDDVLVQFVDDNTIRGGERAAEIRRIVKAAYEADKGLLEAIDRSRAECRDKTLLYPDPLKS